MNPFSGKVFKRESTILEVSSVCKFDLFHRNAWKQQPPPTHLSESEHGGIKRASDSTIDIFSVH
eukprot:5283748-Amphidinium_carterae.1